MRINRLVTTGALMLGVTLAMAAPARAQMPESYRAVQMRALELQRRMLLSMADSMPERLYRDKATPVQRDFAQQLHHSVVVFTFLPRILGGGTAPAAGLPDTAAVFNTRAGMRAYINGIYDYAAGVLRNQTAASRESMVNMFGTQVNGWLVWDELHQHTIWTAGQVVANFRKHNMAPPGFGFF